MSQISKRALGNQGLEVAEIGLGCMALTPCYGHDSDNNEGAAVIHRALDLGVTLVDTAEIYGPFTNEEIVGQALKGRRDEVVLETKLGGFLAADGAVDFNGAHSASFIRRSLDASLFRLGVEYVDVYVVHRIDPLTPVEVWMEALAAEVAKGKIRYLGLSEASAATVRAAHAIHPISVVQSEYSLWSREVEDEVLPVTTELDIGFVAYSPLGRGFLTGKIRRPEDLDATTDWRATSPRFQGEHFERNLEVVDKVRDLAADKGCTPAQLALAWLLTRRPDLVPIQGATKVAEVEENLGASAVKLTVDDLAAIEVVASQEAFAGARADAGYLAQIDAG